MKLPMLELIARDGGLIEAKGRRTWAYRVISRRFDSNPPVPFGWAKERCSDRNAWEVGPAWYILPRRWYRELEWRFYRYAVSYRLAAEPYEGCYWSELVWFPDAPRFE